VSTLRRSEIQGFIYARAAAHLRSAKNELEFLKRALTVSELYELAARLPEHVKRLVLLAGQVGARQNVWFNLTNDLLDLRTRTLTVPAELAKNRREHRVFLTDVEANLLREQLLVRANADAAPLSNGDGQGLDAEWFSRACLARGDPPCRSAERTFRRVSLPLATVIRPDRSWRRLGWIPLLPSVHTALLNSGPQRHQQRRSSARRNPLCAPARTSSDATSSADCFRNTKPQREISFLHPTGSGDAERPVISST
jgi:integrase